MKDETRYLLDDLLASWHKWSKTYSPLNPCSMAPMFAGYSSSRQYDSESDVLDGSIHNDQMASLDFHISELEPMHRTAIGIHARNIATGRSVWTSARLPSDITERQKILAVARTNLIIRLTGAGILPKILAGDKCPQNL